MSNFHKTLLPDGSRLHLQHGPIDLIIQADGDRAEVEAAYGQAERAFDGLLEELVDELSLLRSPIQELYGWPKGRVAVAMAQAASACSDVFVTPMVAVAGAVADEICKAMVKGRRLNKAYVNNGGDIAFYLTGDADFNVGVVTDVEQPQIAMTARLTVDQPIRGIATSGWRGRSHSLGVADAVTVLARTSAQADVTATLIANAVDPGSCPQVVRRTANELEIDSDLGDRKVTVRVDSLSGEQIGTALRNGRDLAELYLERGLIVAAALSLGGRVEVIGDLDAVPLRPPPESVKKPMKECDHAAS